MPGIKKKDVEKGYEKLKTHTRPEKPIDWDLVDTLLVSGCNCVEIAAHFQIHPTNFGIRLEKKYGMGYTTYAYEKRKQGDSLLKHTQYMKALGKSDKGDNTLLIWLGKNRLEQRETPLETNFSEESLNQFGALMKQFQDLQARKIEESSNSEETKS